MGLSTSHEDYLRAIWKLNEWQDHPVTSGELTRALGLSPSTVSEGVQRLVSMGLVRHARYGKISLTEEGRMQALRLVRAHRLIETALVMWLGYSWDEVHEEAEHLEHAVSETFVCRLDAALGRPRYDPHGDRIPPPDASLPHADPPATLADLDEGADCAILRVADDDSRVLKELSDLGLLPGVRVAVRGTRHGLGMVSLDVAGHRVDIPKSVAAAIAVEPSQRHAADQAHSTKTQST